METNIMETTIDWGKYVKQGDDSYRCRDCNSVIMVGKIARTYRVDRHLFGGLAGTGEVHYCRIPFCPQCEPERAFQHGPPIYPDEEHFCPHPPQD